MSLPYFPLYPSDFEAKTSHLTIAEDGAYNRLLRIMWMTPGCSLPNDDAWIMRRVRVDQATYDSVVRVVLGEFFEVENGRLTNAKLAGIFEETNAAHEKRVAAGSKGGKAKSLKTHNSKSSNAVAKPKQPEPEPEPEPEPIREETNVSCEITAPAAIDEVAQAVQHFNATASQASWPAVQKTSATRRSALKARIKDVGGLDAWCEAITRASRSPLLTGQNNRGWNATFDWLANPTNFTKLMEGNYDERTHKPASQPNWRDQTLADEIANAARAR